MCSRRSCSHCLRRPSMRTLTLMSKQPELPTVHRNVARLVVLDSSDRILLLQVRDASNPAFGVCWELPGGGIEADESFRDAAVRELHEETGLALPPQHVDEPRWRRFVEYTYRGERRLQNESIATARIAATAASPVTLTAH